MHTLPKQAPTCKASVHKRYSRVDLQLHAGAADHVAQYDGESFNLQAKRPESLRRTL